MLPSLIFFLTAVSTLIGNSGLPKFRKVEIDSKLEIGYGVVLGDVDGDGKTDIILADKKQYAWYRNPTWQKFVIAENLTERDNVCIAARDIDGDGKVEIAVGAQWNPGETSDETVSGSVHYLIAPNDRTDLWTPVKLPHEPTVHRMLWLKTPEGKFDLVVLPLHGRGNQDGEGAGVRVLAYEMPEDPRGTWKTRLIDDSMHKTHNMDNFINLKIEVPQENLIIGGSEGLSHFRFIDGEYKKRFIVGTKDGLLYNESTIEGVGEVRFGILPNGISFLATVEPMHGNQLVIYTKPESRVGNQIATRNVLLDDIVEGHALACGDLLGIGSDQVVVGWRGNRKSPDSIGVRMFIPGENPEDKWSQMDIDPDGMACEDLKIGDLNGDGRLDIVACGRATKNLRIYINEAP
jgi:hypothetical protein